MWLIHSQGRFCFVLIMIYCYTDEDGGKSICSSNEVLCTHVFQLEKYFYEKQLFITIEKLNIFNRIARGGGEHFQDNEFKGMN